MTITVMWPPELVITESMFRHFTGIAEIAGYLVTHSNIVKENNICVKVTDCAVEVKTALNIAAIARESLLIPLYVNMNNIPEAMRLATFLKSVNPLVCIAIYGEAAACNANLFADLPYIDYVIGNGQIEFALDYILCRLLGLDPYKETTLSPSNISINNKCVLINKILPSSLWGLPALNLIPLNKYLYLSNGELHLLVNKGCPFHCEFCNERLVSSNVLRYRDPLQVATFLCTPYTANIRSVYLDASTFTYDRSWVIKLCEEIQKQGAPLPWKTCTRLDCIDEDLIKLMAENGCVRISVGVETLDEQIQYRNKKCVSRDALAWFADKCKQYGILPRALLIIGLSGQQFSDIDKAKQFCAECGIDGRFRVLQDYSALIDCDKLEKLNIAKLDRWNTWNPFEELEIAQLREIEYPPLKGVTQNYV